MSIKVGIFFGGPSREREISFAGGRTVYDNLDHGLFEPIPIFVDSYKRWYLLEWQYLYRGSIRDFFPPVQDAPHSEHGFQVYQESLGPLDEAALEEMGARIGRRIRREELPEIIDVAFLALHGLYGEDGEIQKELEYAGIPYTGSGVRASEIGMDKALQKTMMAEHGFSAPSIQVIEWDDFRDELIPEYFEAAQREIGWPMVIRPARQGSSIGVAILHEEVGIEGFEKAINAAFFREVLPLYEYADRNSYERLEYVKQLSDLRDGLSFPLDVEVLDRKLTLYTPDEVYNFLEKLVVEHEENDTLLVIFSAHHDEQRVIVESFIDGKEFSCIVVRTPDGGAEALPPTEIVKASSELFDYKSKYMPGRSRKVTPINLPVDQIQAIRAECERLFDELGFEVYARIDGFHTDSGDIFLNDPNTTSGMMPSSFFFHQAAEIGLNPSQFLTYILRMSLQERAQGGPTSEVARNLGAQLDAAIDDMRAHVSDKERIGVMLGGVSFERHISVESGRNIFEKLSSSLNYRPIPLFLTSPIEEEDADKDYVLYHLPINLLLKDNADDIRDKIAHDKEHPVIEQIHRECAAITERYADPDVVFHPQKWSWNELPEHLDGVFIAMHGRPGEDGQVQSRLNELGLYYNGSGVESSSITINKHDTLERLRMAGIQTTAQWLATAEQYHDDPEKFYDEVEERFTYPLIAKPVDDGCSSAVKLIKNREQLRAYCELTFAASDINVDKARSLMKLSHKDEWPIGKNTILFEAAITAEGADKFLEITGGMLTHYGVDGAIRFEVFEPSETLAGGEVLSLEEKFLAGEGQNLTPARLSTDQYSHDYISGQVRADLERIARTLGVEGYCRIDAFVRVNEDGSVDTIPIEVNSLPGMTPATAIFHQAGLAGYQPAEFIAEILRYGKDRLEKKGNESVKDTAFENQQTLAVPPTLAAPLPKNPAPAPAPKVIKQASSSEVAKKKALTDTTPTSDFGKEEKGPVQNFFSLFSKGYFWKNLILALVFLLLLFLGLRLGLGWYTNHNESLELPDFQNMQIEEAQSLAKKRGVKVSIEKGSFDPDRTPGLVVQQHPRPNSKVKKNRTIYLTVLSDEAPMIKLPSLVGNYDYDQYSRQLEAVDIRSRIRDKQYDPKLEENTILYFFYDDKKITDEDLRGEGVRVPQGSILDFVVTIRETGQVEVPTLRCRRFSEAEFVLGGSGLDIGNVNGGVSNRQDAYIVRTVPPAGQSVTLGTKLDVFLSDRRPVDCQ